MAYGELVVDGTLVSSGTLAGQQYEPIPTSVVEAEKVPADDQVLILDENFALVATVPAGDYWVRLSPDAAPIHMTAAEFEAQYQLVTP